MARIGVGVDIGNGAVKIIRIVRTRERYELTGYSKIPFTTPTGGNGSPQLSIIEAIKGAAFRANIKEKNIITAVSSDSVFMRNLKIPIVVGDELTNLIRSEVEKFVPFPINEAEYDWDILRQNQDSGEMEVMVVAAQNQTVSNQITFFKKAGFRPVIMDAQPFAIIRSLGIETGTPDDELKGIVVLDIGMASTQMIIYYLGSVKITRIILIAGADITMAIAEKLQISFDKAEAIKSNLGDADYSFDNENIESESYRANEVIRNKLNELTTEIQHSLDYFCLQYQGAKIHEMILTGGGSKLRNLAKFIKRETGFAVQIGDPLHDLDLNLKQMERSVLLGNPNQFSVAIGLALRGVE